MHDWCFVRIETDKKIKPRKNLRRVKGRKPTLTEKQQKAADHRQAVKERLLLEGLEDETTIGSTRQTRSTISSNELADQLSTMTAGGQPVDEDIDDDL